MFLVGLGVEERRNILVEGNRQRPVIFVFPVHSTSPQNKEQLTLNVNSGSAEKHWIIPKKMTYSGLREDCIGLYKNNKVKQFVH